MKNNNLEQKAQPGCTTIVPELLTYGNQLQIQGGVAGNRNGCLSFEISTAKKEQNKVTEPVSLTVYSAQFAINKEIYLDPESGKLTKQSLAGMAYRGKFYAKHIQLMNLKELSSLIQVLGQNECLSHGAFTDLLPGERTRVLTGDKYISAQKRGRKGVLARGKDTMEYIAGKPGIMMLDYDGDPIEREALDKTVREILPELKETQILYVPSASSYIYSTETGEQLIGSKGWHLYIIVEDASDIPAWGEQIIAGRSWLQGYGNITISKNGSRLVREKIFDNCVYHPERLDFCGKILVGEGLEQRRPDPVILGDGDEYLAMRAPEVPVEDIQKVSQLQQQAKKDSSEKALEVRKQYTKNWVDEQMLALPKRKQTSEAKAELKAKITRALEYGTIPLEHVLHMEDGSKIQVKQLLDNPEAYHGKRFADPYEPEYGDHDHRIAVFFANKRGSGGKIVSHAHGQHTLRVEHQMRPEVKLRKGEQYNIVLECIDGLLLDASFFAYGVGEKMVLQKVDKQTGAMRMMTPDALDTELARCINFKVDKKEGKVVKEISADCPQGLSRRLLAATEYYYNKLPNLRAVVKHPVVTKDGAIVRTPGYHADSQLYVFLKSGEFEEDIITLDDEQMGIALRKILRPFRGVEFGSETDVGVTLALMLTVLLRPLMDTAPGFLLSARQAGSGKTLLAQAMATLTGEKAALDPLPTNEEELQKVILAKLIEGVPLIIFDNVTKLQSDALCTLLTSSYYSSRILGKSETKQLPNVQSLIFTGNNVQVYSDLNRRIMRCNIEPESERPEVRTFNFDLLEEVRDNREEIINALLCLVYTAAHAQPKPAYSSLGSFSDWSKLVLRTISYCIDTQRRCSGEIPADSAWKDVPLLGNPSQSIEQGREDDPEREKLRIVLHSLYMYMRDHEFSCADLIDIASAPFLLNDNEVRSELGENICLVASNNIGKLQPNKLSYWLKSKVGVPCDGLKLIDAKINSGTSRKQWRVVRCEDSAGNAEKTER